MEQLFLDALADGAMKAVAFLGIAISIAIAFFVFKLGKRALDAADGGATDGGNADGEGGYDTFESGDNSESYSAGGGGSDQDRSDSENPHEDQNNDDDKQ